MTTMPPAHRRGTWPVAMTLALAAVLTLVAIAAWPGASVAASSPSEDRLDAAVRMRKLLGLSGGRAHVRGLMTGPADVGSRQNGVPMTRAEVEAIDIDGRVRFADRVARRVLPYLEKRSVYAGAWIDQKDGGRLVVMLTRRHPRVLAGVRSRMPRGSLGLRFEVVETSWSQLQSALRRANGASQAIEPGAELADAAIDVRNNRLRLTFTTPTEQRMRPRRSDLRRRLGVSVAVASGRRASHLEACGRGGKRKNCWDPLRAGVRTYLHAVGLAAKACTMGFHVHKEGAKPPYQWLTAGHCTMPKRRGTLKVFHSRWFHGGRRVGVRKATLYRKQSGARRDIARVSHRYASEASPLIYGESDDPQVVLSHTGVIEGELIRFSGATTGIVTGIVGRTAVSWFSETKRMVVYGARSDGMVSNPGDSGAPVYRWWQEEGTTYIAPVGIVNDNSRGAMVFATLGYALSRWSDWEVIGTDPA